jgi:hypothetical protein
MWFKKRCKATTKFLKQRFQRSDKTWINAGLTPDVMAQDNNEVEGSQGGIDQRVLLALKRIEKGECPFCGIPTHSRTLFGSMRAITVGGSVMNGHCLRCFPIAAFTKLNKADTPKSSDAVVDFTRQPLDEADMLLSIDRRRMSHVSELSGSFYCDIKHLT